MERRFRLQPVLNYRRDREEALQLELAALMAEERAERGRLDALRQASAQAMDDVFGLQARPRTDVAAIQHGLLYLEAITAAIAAQSEVVARVAERVEAKRQEVVAAMQARKAIEKLKERHEQTYAAWARRVEETAIDDMVMVRYNRRAAAGDQVAR
ncbi:MAG TPA: flagellar export protein FliJ [Chloroflexota bacterium]|jgi:flagellar FliJ protein|nr:flagellar export protein FliJ [Chloroflexota bacterium]